jgi:uncharacterized protein (DUF2252 family)
LGIWFGGGVNMTTELVARIERFNTGRDPERLALKYREMDKSPFTFFRGAAHLFWEDLGARRSALADSPLVWACGDLHLENFGAFQGSNGLSYFDLNDFDEAALAPAAWEVSRFVTSVYVASPARRVTRTDANDLVKVFLDAYQAALVRGKAGWIERTSATGMVRTLLDRVKRRKRASLIASRTKRDRGKRRIGIDGNHTLPATADQRREVAHWLAAFAKSQHDPKFFEVLDVALRVAGVGSLGLDRYVILVRGDGGSDGNALLDAKQARPSSLAKFDNERQPVWKSEADRIVSIQHRMQAMAPALLDAVPKEHGGYVLRELQPSKDRLTLKDAKGHPRRLRSAIETMGRLTAWAQLRSSGREGSAIVDDLIAFARGDSWQRELIAYARSYAARVDRDYKEFVAAQKEGR